MELVRPLVTHAKHDLYRELLQRAANLRKQCELPES